MMNSQETKCPRALICKEGLVKEENDGRAKTNAEPRNLHNDTDLVGKIKVRRRGEILPCKVYESLSFFIYFNDISILKCYT